MADGPPLQGHDERPPGAARLESAVIDELRAHPSWVSGLDQSSVALRRIEEQKMSAFVEELQVREPDEPDFEEFSRPVLASRVLEEMDETEWSIFKTGLALAVLLLFAVLVTVLSPHQHVGLRVAMWLVFLVGLVVFGVKLRRWLQRALAPERRGSGGGGGGDESP
jgi:hypothetical protein